MIQVIPEWSSGFPYFLQFTSEFGNRSSWSEPQSAPGLVFGDRIELRHYLQVFPAEARLSHWEYKADFQATVLPCLGSWSGARCCCGLDRGRQRSAPHPLWKNLETVTIHSDNCVKQKIRRAFVVAAASPPDYCTTLTPLMLASSPRMFLIQECFLPFLKKSASFIPSGIYMSIPISQSLLPIYSPLNIHIFVFFFCFASKFIYIKYLMIFILFSEKFYTMPCRKYLFKQNQSIEKVLFFKNSSLVYLCRSTGV